MGSIFFLINQEKISDGLPLLSNHQITVKAAREGEVGEWGFNYFQSCVKFTQFRRRGQNECQSRGEKIKRSNVTLLGPIWQGSWKGF
jgi:hypothetical protein